MFQWILKRIITDKMLDSLSEKFLNRTLDYVQSKEFQEQIVVVTDALFERYKAKMFSSIGGTMKGMSYALDQNQNPGFNPMAFLGGKSGKVNWMQLLASMFLGAPNQPQDQKALENKGSVPNM